MRGLPSDDENLEDLLLALGDETQVLSRCDAAGIRRSGLQRLRNGTGHAAEFQTIHDLAALLAVDVDRVDRAVSVLRRGVSKQC